MNIVLDTNALLVSMPRKSIYRPIFDALIEGKFHLILSNDILTEYLEIIERKANTIVASNVAEMLLKLDNVIRTEVFFEWNLMVNDPDDNKFVDAAIVGGADLIVSNDQHFNALKTIAFPHINVITIEAFLDKLANL